MFGAAVEETDALADSGIALHLLTAFGTLVQLLPPALYRFVLGHVSSNCRVVTAVYL
jgi:hypothetical protein